MNDLVERLLANIDQPLIYRDEAALREAATALEAKEAEIAALQRALFFWMPGVDARLDEPTRELASEDALLLAGYDGTVDGPCWGDAVLARAETAERERVAEWNLRREAESQRDVEKAAVATLRRERDQARAALKAFLPDPTMMDILWGDMDDEATGTHTVKLKHFRAARAITGE